MIVRAESDIQIGHHVERTFLGMTINIDTVISTLIAGGLVLLLGFLARAYLTRDLDDHVPSKLQLLWEVIVGEVNKQVQDNLGKVHPYVAPLAVSLFFFILFANWLELLPTKLNEQLHLTPAPTADTNLTYALAIFAVGSVWVYGFKVHGFTGFFKHLVPPSMSANKSLDVVARGALTVLHVLEELVKPITLALRLFGNIFAGGIMLILITMLVSLPFGIGYGAMPVMNLAWKAFDMVIGLIQAFIFALLTVLYFAMAGAGHDDHDDHAGGPDKTPERAH